MEKKENQKGREIEKAECATCTRHRSPGDTGTRPVIPFVFNELSLSLDYRTRGFDVVMGSNESIDNVDELMMLVIHRQSSSTLRCRLVACLVSADRFSSLLLFPPSPSNTLRLFLPSNYLCPALFLFRRFFPFWFFIRALCLTPA